MSILARLGRQSVNLLGVLLVKAFVAFLFFLLVAVDIQDVVYN
jgi:hypothetical protein